MYCHGPRLSQLLLDLTAVRQPVLRVRRWSAPALEFHHDEPGIRPLGARLVRLRMALVAIERPAGLLIEQMLDPGLAVAAVHPNQVKWMRPRYSLAGGTSDSFDSFVLVELARTDFYRFRRWSRRRPD